MQYSHRIIIDFETFYDPADRYGLRTMTAYEYITDPRFQIILLSVKIDNNPAFYMTGHDMAAMGNYLRSLPWEDAALGAHNGVFFDFLILSWCFGIVPRYYLDSLLMARPLLGVRQSATLDALCKHYGLPPKGKEVEDAKGKRLEHFTPAELAAYASYCVNDTERCADIISILVGRWRLVDLEWMSLCCRMGAKPEIVLDHSVIMAGLHKESEKVGGLLEDLAHQLMLSQLRLPPECWKAKGRNAAIPPYEEALRRAVGSAPIFCDLLEKLGETVPLKYSEKQKKMVPALSRNDSAFLALQDSTVSGVPELVAARIGVKSTIMASRLERVRLMAERTGTMPIFIEPFKAHTGRNAGCLSGDTMILVKDPEGEITEKRITEVKITDLVWDGEDFVAHEGVVFSGIREVITYDGITGTPDHIVFTARGEMPLAEAAGSGTPIQDAPFHCAPGNGDS